MYPPDPIMLGLGDPINGLTSVGQLRPADL